MDEFSGIERLLGLPDGSTTPNKVTNAVVKKANELDKKVKQNDLIETKLSPSDMVKMGITMESLEQDRIRIRNDAFEVFRIGKLLLDKFKEDTENLIDMSDRMYTAGFKGIESLVNALDKLNNMIMKFKQEEEMKNLNLIGDTSDGTLDMTPEKMMEFIEHAKNQDKKIDMSNIKDAEIVEPNDSDNA
jgi:hypothetical protein